MLVSPSLTTTAYMVKICQYVTSVHVCSDSLPVIHNLNLYPMKQLAKHIPAARSFGRPRLILMVLLNSNHPSKTKSIYHLKFWKRILSYPGIISTQYLRSFSVIFVLYLASLVLADVFCLETQATK